MKKLSLTALTLLMSAAFAQASFALTIDNSTDTSASGAAKFEDPDNNVPVAHLGDDGRPVSNFQGQAVGNSGVTLNFSAPSQNSDNGADAFQRAQQRMQQ